MSHAGPLPPRRPVAAPVDHLRRRRRLAAAALAGALLSCGGVLAQGYPKKPVTLVLPYAPGGTIDIQGRLLASGLTQKLGQPFIARNMPGATGAIATDFVAHAQPDGYTLLFGSSAQTTSVPMTEKVNYRLEDLAPVSASGRGSMVLAISLNTVATHVRNILNKTQCANRTEAATYAIRHGLQGAQSVTAALSPQGDDHGTIHD